MDDEVQWHRRYDSLFNAFPIKVPTAVLEQLQLQSMQRIEWQRVAYLPELSKLFELLQGFISDNRNWMKKRCSDNEMARIQQKLNALMMALQCQKCYGRQFWRAQPRRVQASIVHAYIFLKMLVAALIPSNYSSLLHANSEEKLMTEIFKLENLVNEWIQHMRQIHSFMFSQEFQSERQLTELFFSQLFQFFKAVPRIQKTSLGKPPKIMEFINVCLEIEAQEQEISSGGSNKSLRRQSQNLEGRSQRENNFLNREGHKRESIKNLPEFFRFDERVRVHTAFQKKKKLTVTSIQTKEKTQSNQKSRSPSLDRSLTIFESGRMKRGTLNESPERESSNPKVRSRILTSKTNNSSPSRERSRKKSLQGEYVQQERDSKIKKSKIAMKPIKIGCLSQQINIQTGVCRGWGILRQYLKKRIAQRKLKRLLLL